MAASAAASRDSRVDADVADSAADTEAEVASEVVASTVEEIATGTEHLAERRPAPEATEGTATAIATVETGTEGTVVGMIVVVAHLTTDTAAATVTAAGSAIATTGERAVTWSPSADERAAESERVGEKVGIAIGTMTDQGTTTAAESEDSTAATRTQGNSAATKSPPAGDSGLLSTCPFRPLIYSFLFLSPTL